MTKREKLYFVKQKLIGVLFMELGVLSTLIIGDATAGFVMGLLGLGLLSTKEKVWMDDYFYETEEGHW